MTYVRSIRVARFATRLLSPKTVRWAAIVISIANCFAGVVPAQGATFGWDRVNSHTNLSAYILKYGGTSGSYTGSVSVATNVTTATVNNFAPGRTYYLIVTARNVSGVESDPSNEISFTAPGTIVNATPVANSASVSTAEDQSRTITLTGSDSDGDALTFAVLSAPANGTLSGTAPNLTYTPASNFSGADSFTFRANDGIANSATATISLTVTAVNDPPTLNGISSLTLSTNAGPQSVNLGGISSGAGNENQTVTVTATSSNPGLIPSPAVTYTSPNTTGSLTFTPAANASGSATITVTVNDGQSQNNTASRSFTVTVGNPSTRTLFVEAESGTRVAPVVVASDANASGGQYIYTQTDEAGSLSLTFNITLAGDYVVWCRVLSTDISSDSFYVSYDGANDDTYVTTPNTWSSAWQWSQLNGLNLGNPRLLTLSQGSHTLRFRGRESSTYLDCLYITNDRNFVPPASGGPNKPPTLSAINNRTISEDAAAQTVNLSGISAGTGENQTLTLSATSSNPSLIPNPTVNYTSPSATGTLSFTPLPNANGTATIAVLVDDGQSMSNTFTRTFTVTVTPVNDPPTLNPLGTITINEDAGPQTVSLTGIGTGAANEIQTLTLTATSGTTSLIPNPTISYTSPNTAGTLTFRPATNANGTATITLTVDDAQSQNHTFTRTFTVTVNPVNDLPTISNIADQSITQGAATAALAFTIGDVETAVGSLTLTGTSSNPSLVPNANILFGGTTANRTVRVTPVPTASGTATITIRVTDASGASATDTFTLTATPVNQPPTLNPLGNLTINEDAGPQLVNLSGITVGALSETQTLTITATSSNPGLIPNPLLAYTSPNPAGTLTFTPATNASGAATITVTVNDGQSQNNTLTRTFTVTVNPLNDPPTLSDLANQTVNESTPTATLPFTIGDVETSASSLTLSATSSNPALVPVANILFGGSGASRTLRVTPVSTLFGSAIITVNVTDASSAVASDTFTLTVSPVNQAPTLNAIANVTLAEDAAQQTVNLAGISTGAANEFDTLTLTATSSNPSLIPNPAVSYTSPSATGTLSFTPLANANGTATITLTLNDGQGHSNLTTRAFTVTVTPLNDTPTLNAFSPNPITIMEDAGPQTVSLSGISSGAANENQTLTITATSSTPGLIPNPTVSYSSPNAVGTLTFRSTTNSTGSAVITVTVNDGQSQNNTIVRTLNVTVVGVNDAPTISNIPDQSINQGSATAVLPFVVGDTETPVASLTVTASSSNPTLVPPASIVLGGAGANRTVTVTPPSNRSGTAVITVLVTDGNNGTATEQFTLAVNAVNQPPTLDPILDLVVNEDSGERTVSLAGISTGAFDELQTLTITAVSGNPSLIPNPEVDYVSPNFTGTLSFTPAANASGTALITVTVNDGQSQSSTITRAFMVTVNPLNDSPTISNITDQNINQNTSTAAIPFTIGDVESAIGALAVAANSSNPGLVPNANIVFGGSGANRTVRVTPALNQFGSTVITLTVVDGDGGVNSDSFIVTVSAVNFRPTLDPMIDRTIVEDAGPQTVALTGISSGSVGEIQTLAITAVSSDPGLIPNPTVNYTSPGVAGSLVFAPLPDAHGAAVITVTIDDGQVQNNVLTRSFTVTVNSVNDAPTLNPVANVTLIENTVMHNVALSGIGSGAANESQTLAVTAVSSDPALVPHPAVGYFSPNSSGTLTLNPAADSIGTATITITVNDGDSANHLAVRTFTVTISGTNSAPTITDLPDRTIPMNGVASSINFTVGDAETPGGNLTVVATSSNPALVWTNNIVISGLGSSNRVATVIPTAFQHGYSVITLTVYDQNGASSSDSFVLTVVPPNVAPTLDPLSNLLLDEDFAPQVVNLTGISAGGPSENQPLIVSAYSGNPSVIPHPTVTYSSPDATGTLTIRSASNAVGSATIVITVNDGQGADFLVTRVFGISVNGVNDPPVISSIPNQVVEQNMATGDVPFLLSDPETAPSSLSVTAISSDQTLVPNGNIIMSGSGVNRTITVTPASFQSGTATITILASDGFLSASTSFQITVGAGNTPPVVAAPAALVGDSYSETEVAIVITDRESRPEDLVLTAASYNATVLPDSNITLGGSGSNRVVKCRPVPGKSGDVTVSLSVSDGRAMTRRAFRLNVQQGTAPRAPISVRRIGRGTVKPVLDGDLLAIGQRYSISAVPAPDEVFVRWSGGVTSTLPTIAFIMVSNLVLEVTFTNNPYIAMKGSYNGLFHEAAEVRHGSSGNFTVTPTDRGTYTGTLKLGSKKHSVSGALDLGRRGTNTILRTGTNSLTVEFDFGGGGTNQVVGRVSDGVWEAPLLGDRAIFHSKTNPAPYAGSYTVILPGQDDGNAGPEGDGFGTMKVDGNGGAALAGTLADGSKFSLKVPLSMHGQCPAYVPLYSGYGSILSWLTVTNRPTDDLTGLLSWIRPAQIKAKQYPGGFTNDTMAIGSIYVRPLPATNPAISLAAPAVAFAGGNLASPFANAIVLGASSKVINLGANKLSLSIATASGLFKGSVTDPSSGKSFAFSGALLQKQNVGAGFLLGTNRSSRVLLGESAGN